MSLASTHYWSLLDDDGASSSSSLVPAPVDEDASDKIDTVLLAFIIFFCFQLETIASNVTDKDLKAAAATLNPIRVALSIIWC